MGRNGSEVAIHECPVLQKRIDFGLLSFGRVWVCRYCKQELNVALDSLDSVVLQHSDDVNKERQHGKLEDK